MCKRITILVSILALVLTAGVQADLEGYWKFDEGSGNTVSDSSGNGRDGTISGASWHAVGWDGTGRSLDFDGTNDVVELGAFDVVGSGITLAAWIRPDDFGINGSRIISKADEFHDNDHWWMLSEFGDNRLRFRLKTTDGSPTTTLIASSGNLAAGQWQHAAATWDGAVMRVYLNSVEGGSVAKGGDAVATDANVKVAIGSQPSDAFDTDPSHVERFFDGLIDEVVIYNVALSAAEIQDLFNGVLPVLGPPNDECVDAESVGDVKDLPFDTTDATFDGSGLCMTSPNIWYCYTATCTGNVTVDLAGSSFDTMLAVYDGCECYPTSDDLIECNDDTGAGYQSAVTFAAIEGNQYLIEVGGYGSETGEGLLTVSCVEVVLQDKTDLGDAPDRTNNFNKNMTAYMWPDSVNAHFPTVFNDGSGTGPFGPIHVNDKIVAYLGKRITRETEADTGADEDPVHNLVPSSNQSDRDFGDDGIVIPLNLPSCRFTTFDYIVTVVDPNVDLWVNVWLDWNRDGDWDDTLDCERGPVPEWAVKNQFLINLPTGVNQITSRAILSLHPEDKPEDIWMRITLSEQPWKTGSNPGVVGNAGSGPQEKYQIGETEDYYFTPDVSYTICEDYNGDGVIDMDDLVFYTAEWLENCP